MKETELYTFYLFLANKNITFVNLGYSFYLNLELFRDCCGKVTLSITVLNKYDTNTSNFRLTTDNISTDIEITYKQILKNFF